MPNVEFKRGLQEALPSERNSDTFYVTTDTGRMYSGEHLIGENLAKLNVEYTAIIGLNNRAGISGFYVSEILDSNGNELLTSIEEGVEFITLNANQKYELVLSNVTQELFTCTTDGSYTIALKGWPSVYPLSDVLSHNPWYWSAHLSKNPYTLSNNVTTISSTNGKLSVYIIPNTTFTIAYGVTTSQEVNGFTVVPRDYPTATIENSSLIFAIPSGGFEPTQLIDCPIWLGAAPAVAIGANSIANSSYAVAIGNGAQAIGYHSGVWGRNSYSKGESSVVIGPNSSSISSFCYTIGSNNVADSNSSNSYLFGDNLICKSPSNTLTGFSNTINSGNYNFITGYNNQIETGNYNVVGGNSNKISSTHAVISGYNNNCATSGLVLGKNNTITTYSGNNYPNIIAAEKDTIKADFCAIIGQNQTIEGNYNFTLGNQIRVGGEYNCIVASGVVPGTTSKGNLVFFGDGWEMGSAVVKYENLRFAINGQTSLKSGKPTNYHFLAVSNDGATYVNDLILMKQDVNNLQGTDYSLKGKITELENYNNTLQTQLNDLQQSYQVVLEQLSELQNSVSTSSTGYPIEESDSTKLITALNDSANTGKIYRYTGIEADGFIPGRLYICY